MEVNTSRNMARSFKDGTATIVLNTSSQNGHSVSLDETPSEIRLLLTKQNSEEEEYRTSEFANTGGWCA